ncbi:hypothetical protein NC651_020699 [Populus alba x Populus x berolinensis]|nr:hypothetical protein NC651_020699 [Populus alba x Populus x berolinensis]
MLNLIKLLCFKNKDKQKNLLRNNRVVSDILLQWPFELSSSCQVGRCSNGRYV